MASMQRTSGRLPTVAVAEDNQELCEEVLVPSLLRAGFDAVGIFSSHGLYRAMAVRSFDLILLDVALPDEDGLSVTTQLRGRSPTLGIVILTGRGTAEDQLRGLRAGADAYLFKPPEIGVVVNTLRNLARRTLPHVEASMLAPMAWRLANHGWTIVAPGEVEIKMNQAEHELMRILTQSMGYPVSREELMARLHKGTLEMLVYRLRKKCMEAAGRDLPLDTVPGIGYVLHW